MSTYDDLNYQDLDFGMTGLKTAAGKTSVIVTYLPFSGPPIGWCQITIYTATGPRHPVLAEISEKGLTGWEPKGTQLVNNYKVGLKPNSFSEITLFTFDCPAPGQFWEIQFETPPYSPLPNFLDSMIPSCEPRGFVITYPGLIARVPGTGQAVNTEYADALNAVIIDPSAD